VTRFDTTTHEHSPTRLAMLAVADSALDAVDPQRSIARAVVREGDLLRIGSREVNLADHSRAVILGFGKASVAMGRAALRLLEGMRVAGVLVPPVPARVAGLEVLAASHPIPDQRSRAGGYRVLEAARSVGPSDLVVVLISGGGSALLAAPASGVLLDDLVSTNALLLRSGATIGELNTVRKHLSAVKGGRLAEVLASAGAIVTLVLSDVVGNPLDVIASGPMVPDPTTFADALAVLDRHGLRHQVSQRVVRHLEEGAAGDIPDTPSVGAVFDRQILTIVADAGIAAEAAVAAARQRLGPSRIVTTELEGEAREVAKALVADADALEPGSALVYTGETTVTVTGEGRGGRNQELALAASIVLDGRDDVVVLSLGTDGIDGMTTSAGGFADGTAVARGRELGLDARDHLDRNDAHTFLEAVGDTVDSGSTGTNVGDLILVRRM
jgi:hydroxypyruvate reductase